MDSEDIAVRWSVVDPRGKMIVLKDSTYEDHVGGDHEDRDASYRMKTEHLVKKVLSCPASSSMTRAAMDIWIILI